MLVVCPMEILSLFLKLLKKIKFPWTGSNLGLSLTLFLHLTTRTEFLFLVLKFDFLYFWAKNQRDFQSKRFLVTKIIFWNIWSQKMFWDIWSQNWISPQNFYFSQILDTQQTLLVFLNKIILLLVMLFKINLTIKGQIQSLIGLVKNVNVIDVNAHLHHLFFLLLLMILKFLCRWMWSLYSFLI